MLELFGVGLSHILRTPGRSGLTALGVVIGVAAVIAMVTLGRGASQKVNREVDSVGATLLIITAGGPSQQETSFPAPPLKLEDAIAMEREINTLSRVAPVASKAGLVVFGAKNRRTSVFGITEQYLPVRGLSVAYGGNLESRHFDGGVAGCLIGSTIEDTLFDGHSAIGARLRVESTSCTVTGVLKAQGKSTTGADKDDLVLLPLSVYQRRLSGEDDISGIFLSLRRPSLKKKAKTQLKELMRQRHHLTAGDSDDFSVHDMAELSKTLDTIMSTLTALLSAIAAVSLFVGGVGIMNMMLTAVSERTREIGVRLALGAAKRDILLQFLFEAATLSAIGGVLGVVLGVAVAAGVGQLLELPFVLKLDVVIVALIFAATTGIVFGALPAVRAARMKPAEALRLP